MRLLFLAARSLRLVVFGNLRGEVRPTPRAWGRDGGLSGNFVAEKSRPGLPEERSAGRLRVTEVPGGERRCKPVLTTTFCGFLIVLASDPLP